MTSASLSQTLLISTGIEMTAREGDNTEVPAWPVKLPMQYMSVSPDGTSVAMQVLGGRSYPMVSVKNCHTCNSAYRKQIEIWLLEARSYGKILQYLPEDAKTGKGAVTLKSISNHKNRGHMPLEVVARREISEQRANEMGYDIMHSGASLADYITLGKTIIVEVFEKLARGEIEPDLKDAVQWAKLIQQAEVIGGADLDYEIMFRAFVEYQTVVRELTDETTFRSIAERIATNAILHQMIEKKTREDVIDVESDWEDADWEVIEDIEDEDDIEE